MTVRVVLFSKNDALKIRIGRNSYVPLPAEPIPSLTTENGYVVAVVQDNGMVRGIYDDRYHRYKFDMISDTFRYMGTKEVTKFPVDYVFEHSSSIVCLIPHTHCNPWQSH